MSYRGIGATGFVTDGDATGALWGTTGDVPIAADYDGDGVFHLAEGLNRTAPPRRRSSPESVISAANSPSAPTIDPPSP